MRCGCRATSPGQEAEQGGGKTVVEVTSASSTGKALEAAMSASGVSEYIMMVSVFGTISSADTLVMVPPQEIFWKGKF